MWLEIVLAASAAFFAIAGILFLYGAWRWRASTELLHRRLEAGRAAHRRKAYSEEELNALPPPVQRYFRQVLQEGQPIIAGVRIKQTGALNMSETAEAWKPFTAIQRVVTQLPGFDWDASISTAPGFPVRVHDAYAAGEGILQASLLGLLTIAEIRGTPDAARGELMRFFAEAVWYPTALLPREGVRWQDVDARSAKATLSDGQTEVALLIRFDDQGLVEEAFCESRGRATAKGVVQTPWAGRISHYERFNGMLIPLEAEASWILPEGRKPYWRGRVVDIAYEFASS